MSNNLRRTLDLISALKIVPLEQAHLLEMIPDKDLTFVLGDDIDAYGFSIDTDRVEDIFNKYFNVQPQPEETKNKILSIVDKNAPIHSFGSAC